jgi:hypothetical protein
MKDGVTKRAPMRQRQRVLALLAVLLVVVFAKLAQQLYRFVAFGDERTQLARLEAEVETAGLRVVSSLVLADTLRVNILERDTALATSRADLERLERQMLSGVGTSPSAQQSYREMLMAYNRRVAERNDLIRQYYAALDTNRIYLERYSVVADSIRAVAAAMGEPFYPVPIPAEIAASREEAGNP